MRQRASQILVTALSLLRPGTGTLRGHLSLDGGPTTKFWLVVLLLTPMLLVAPIATAVDSFAAGVQAYTASDFGSAAAAFQESVAEQPAAGAYQNLGNAEWQRGRVGPAVLAWERALWLSPGNTNSHNNLQYARSVAQIESPDLAWYEVVSAWMPASWWAIITAVSFWFVAALIALPGILRCPRASWQQALAAVGLTFFLLSLPAHFGWYTRSKLGIVLEQNTPLRLTPTELAEDVTRVGAGEPGRCERKFGNYYFVRFRTTAGWLTREEFALVAPR